MAIVKDFKGFNIQGENIFTETYNDAYFNSGKEMVGCYAMVMMNFVESGKDTFVEYLKDSVKNNYMLNDMLNEVEWKFDGVEVVIPSEEISYLMMGHFHFANVEIVVSGSYMFIKDGETKYLYYTD